MSKYDIVVGGGGINGLTAAAYLVKAGLSVCVLEYQKYLGGGCWSMKDPVVPGVIHDPCATVHGLIQCNPMIANDELGLRSKYGLEYIQGDAIFSTIFPEKGFAVTLYKDLNRTLEEISQKLSPKEAENYKKFFTFLKPGAQMMVPGLFSPPTPYVTTLSMLDGAGEYGRALMRMMMLSAWDITTEWFETDEMREILSRFVSESMISPFEKGTGSALIAITNLLHTYGTPVAKGGSQALPNALERFILDNGGVIRRGVKVKSVKVVSGVAKAFVLEDGEEVEGTRALFSTFHVKQLFGENGMVNADLLEDNFRQQINNLRYSDYMALNQHIVLKELPKYKVFGNQPAPAIAIEQGHGHNHFRNFFSRMAVGEPSPADSGMALTSTMVDPSRAPNGEHTLYLYSFEPWDLYGDSKNWDKHGKEIADQKLASLQSITSNLGEDNILSRAFHTPLDYSREKLSWLHGDFCHIAQSMDQNLSGRPTMEMARYKTPIDKLYIGGCCTHPGPTITGGGRAQVQVIFEDLGIDFDDVISK